MTHVFLVTRDGIADDPAVFASLLDAQFFAGGDDIVWESDADGHLWAATVGSGQTTITRLLVR